MTLLGDLVMIRRQRDAKIGQIHVPDNVDTKPRIGIVEAIGPGAKLPDGTRRQMGVAVGDRVTFSLDKGRMTKVPGVDGEDRLLISEAAIHAVIGHEADCSAVASPWPGWVADGPQDPTSETM